MGTAECVSTLLVALLIDSPPQNYILDLVRTICFRIALLFVLQTCFMYILYNNDESDDNPMVWARSVVEGRHHSKQGGERK